jgi:alkaline phosphatase D
MPGRPSRRALFEYSAAALGGLGGPSCTQHPAAFTPGMQRPAIDWGIQIGDVLQDRAIVWSRTDRAARFVVEWSESERFFVPRRASI